MRASLFIVLFLFATKLCAQTCSIQAPLKSCKGEPVSFKAVNTGTPIAYQWNFNGEGTSSVASPVFIFNNTGTKTITLKLFYSGGATCTATLSITVNAPPVAKVKVDTVASYFCLSGNKICLKDESTRGPSGVPLKQRVIVWGDGAYNTNYNPETDPTDCYSYGKTGTYDITVELTDSNGCKVSSHLTAKVAKTLDAKFGFDLVRFCDSALLCVYNQSQYDSTLSTYIEWDIGGMKNNQPGFCRPFYSDGNVEVKLKISNAFCTDTASIKLNVKAKVDTAGMSADKHRVCFSDRNINFTGTAVKDAIYDWDLCDSNKVIKKNFHSGNDNKQFIQLPGVGKWFVAMRMTVGLCTRTVWDSVVVIGTNAVFTLANSMQCTSRDTVITCPSLTLYGTVPGNLKFLWHFGDALAPQCTSTTSAGNCNWVRNGGSAKHFYLRDTCFTVKMTVTDTVHNCVTENTALVSIGKPSLSDLGYTFVQHCYIPGNKNSPYAYYFDPKNVKPDCGVTGILINTDSAKAGLGFKDMSQVNTPYYIYDAVTDPDGWITLGVVLQQGFQSIATSCSTSIPVNRVCSDTFWYHKEYRLLPEPYAPFYLDKNKGCKPLTVSATLYTPNQKFVQTAIWDWADGDVDTIPYPPGTTTIQGATHTYRKSGVYAPSLILINENGCSNVFSGKVTVGHFSAIISDTIQCPAAAFKERVEYWNANTGHWKNPFRAKAGLEQLWWDFGDGDTGSGINPVHFYKSNGTYYVKLITKDSAACFDTIVQKLQVVGPKAGIRAPLLESVCNEIISFYDSSQKMGTHLYDSIRDYFWDFGDSKNPSILKDATHAYTNFGKFTITHIVTNERGCKDTATIEIRTIGPEPRFIIDGDSDGCQPFTVKLKNLSDTSTISDYIWKLGDPDSTTVSLASDSSIGFTYKHPGEYYISLTGAKSVKSPTTGNTYYCIARYPDPPLYPPVRVIVWPRPQAGFSMPDTFCPGQLVTLLDTSEPGYSRYKWYISNGDSIYSAVRSAYWSTADTGSYDIIYAPEYDPIPPADLCVDSAFKKVYVAPVKADFDIDDTLSVDPVFVFKNRSSFANQYIWNFGHEGSLSNSSFEVHPNHNYDPDTGYFIVCLRARNSVGCEDTVCKPVHVTFFPFVFYYNVFTPGNGDKKNDDFDINIFGESYYYLKIYNRWGHLVFQSNSDAEEGDGGNWNGKMHNTGEECPAGTYYYVFNYRLLQRPVKTVNGTVTLIRE